MVSAWIEIGTFCRFSERFWAVTMISWSSAAAAAVWTGWAAGTCPVCAKAAPEPQSMVVLKRPSPARVRKDETGIPADMIKDLWATGRDNVEFKDFPPPPEKTAAPAAPPPPNPANPVNPV